ncbi:Lymphocyte antigen 75 [Apodemus speciosus]|uniref:Lymphocyte antigen 75 n=1 Tax=Apodemus speciosus TaxID=105296 RepID=A0ABQ0EHM8_APOSI
MRTHWVTPGRAAGLLVLLLRSFGLVEPSERSGNDPFTIVNENTGKCIQPLSDWIVAQDCMETNNNTLWKWVSQHRLFHLESQKCLGLDITKATDNLRMFSCDSDAMLWWKCEHHSLYTAAQYRLALKDGYAVASTNTSDVWKKGGSEANLCDQPYREIYTRDGNSYGRPCQFPFLIGKTWYHDCIHDEDHNGPWCATTLSYEYDQKWGICLQPENGCEGNWEKNEQIGSCYQFNNQEVLSWKEAYVSCQNQGADLLSIHSAAELAYITGKEDIARIVWLGLNQLYSARGWEWSDFKPLKFLNWDPGTPVASLIGGSSCARMDTESGLWQSVSCESQQPYICKKPLNNPVELPDVWTYSDTHCDVGWLPSNGFCYLLANDSGPWDAARLKCKAFGADLISIHSLADVEVVVTKLHSGDVKEEIWTGLKNTNSPALFQWSDGTEVTLTYWNENQPSVPYNKTPNCVSYLGKLGQWKVQSCEKKLRYVCKKRGEITEHAQSDKLCPPDEGWKRHGETCYKIYEKEVPFGTNCNLTITSRFEQEFLNDLMKNYDKSLRKYFWTGLRDANSRGEYSWAVAGGVKQAVTFSNWNFLEPASPGGCVAMSTGRTLGKWEVKDCRSFRALSICKKVRGPQEPEEEAAPRPDDPCPEGWHTFPSSLSCYKDQFSGQRWFWIGLNKRSPDLQGSWQWSDRTPVSAVIMEPEFQQDYDIRDCAAVKVLETHWQRIRHFYDERDFAYSKPFACDAKLEWVCQIPKEWKLEPRILRSTRTRSTPQMPDWYNPERAGIHGPPVIIEGSEYWFVADPHLNYEEAVLYCASNHSFLATITSFTGLKISSNEQKWWVKTSEDPIDHYFLGSRGRMWHRPHFPMMFGDECLHMSAKTWFLDLSKRADCNAKLPFICEKYNVSSLEKYSPDPAAKVQCTGKWIPFRNKCFLKVNSEPVTFSQASGICHSYGGTLPSVLSQSEQDFITSLLPDMEASLWIGLRWSAYEKISKWTDGRELIYSNFHPLLVGRRLSIPTNFFDDESHFHCALILNLKKSPLTGTWNFTSCSERHSLSLCQKYSETEDGRPWKNTSETVKYLSNLYKIVSKPLTWHGALKECLKESMRLVAITDPYQQAFLAVQAALRNTSFWIGLSSQDLVSLCSPGCPETHSVDPADLELRDPPASASQDELNFGWSDGKRLHFSNWAGSNEQLDDYETEEEVRPLGSAKCPSPVQSTPWIPFQNSCYNFMVTKNRHKTVIPEEVQSMCEKLHSKAHSLSIRSEEENTFVVEQLLHFNYIASWVVLGVTYGNNSLMWFDKTALSYTHWRMGRPTVKNGNFLAGLRTDGFWDIQPFNVIEETLRFYQHSIFACKIEMVDYKDKHNSTLPQFIPHEDSIYNVIQKKVTWYEALNECSQSGGQLASVHNPNAKLFLEDVVNRDGFPLWIGLSSHDGSQSSFEWSDGSAFDYVPWKDPPSPGDCVVLYPKGVWRREKCLSVKDGAICYKPAKCRAGLKAKELSSQAQSSKCPVANRDGSQWIQYGRHCYTSDQALHSFSEAKQLCQELAHSATVVTIADENENRFVSRVMRENYNITMRVWLGLSQHSLDQSWSWLDGLDVTFVKWENKSKDGDGKCSILIASNETWRKVKCSHGYARAVCKIPLSPDYRGIAILFAVLSALALLSGLIWFLLQRSHFRWAGFSSVRYEHGANEDEVMLPSFHD